MFGPNGIFYRLITRFSQMVLLSFCWLLCSLPIVTIGASSAALYAVIFRLLDDDDAHLVRRFFGYFKFDFKHATLVWLPLMFVGFFLLWSGYLYFWGIPGLPDISDFFLVILLVAAVVYLICLTYVFACVARYENTVGQTIKNAIFIGLRYILRTIVLAAISLTVIFAVMWNYTTMLLGLILAPAFVCYINASFIKRIFGELEAKQNARES